MVRRQNVRGRKNKMTKRAGRNEKVTKRSRPNDKRDKTAETEGDGARNCGGGANMGTNALGYVCNATTPLWTTP